MHRHRPIPGRRAHCASRGGFTVAEALIVMALIAIIAGFALPKWDRLPSQADAGMRLVRGSLALAQRMAVQHQHDMVVSFDAAGHRIRIGEDSTEDGHVEAAERDSWESFETPARLVSPSSPVPGSATGLGIAGPGVRMVDGLPSVIFRRNGAASGDVVVYVGAVRGTRTELRAVTVLHSTGRNDSWRYARGSWTQGDL
jgi:Tfp pilus assembly protein FimT